MSYIYKIPASGQIKIFQFLFQILQSICKHNLTNVEGVSKNLKLRLTVENKINKMNI